jgi:predicted HicB family RNase H-like nuclease
MEYKGYVATVIFDEEANLFHGEVLNLRDVITFEGETVNELKQAFHDSIDDYLEYCAERGEDPEKPYSGRFVVRVDPELHKTIAIEAQKRGQSINSLVSEALSKAIEKNTQQGHAR